MCVGGGAEDLCPTVQHVLFTKSPPPEICHRIRQATDQSCDQTAYVTRENIYGNTHILRTSAS